MKLLRLLIVPALLVCLLFSGSLYAQKEIDKTFDAKKAVKLELALGSCWVKSSNDDKIHVHLEYSYDDESFEAIFRDKGRNLNIKEKFFGNGHDGYSNWTISLPKDVELDFNSGTGDLNVDKVTAEIDGNTGTGDIEIKNAKGEFDLNSGTGHLDISDSEGEFDLNSGTGDVNIKNSKGNFDANSGTGDVEAYDITIEDEGDFNSGTGDVEVTLPKGDDYDLSLNSGTDDAILDMDGIPIEGYFEFTADSRRGDIVCPVDFDEEEEDWKGNSEVMRKSFTKGKKTPRFFISTGTGKAKLVR